MEDRIRIVIEAETQRAIANLRQAQREARNTATNFQNSAKETNSLNAVMPRLSAGMAALGVSAAAAGAALGAFAKASYDMAAQVQASTQVVNRLFGESAEEIQDFSKSAADSLGISEEAALKYSAVYGNLLSGFVKDSDVLSQTTQEMLQQSAVIAAATGRTIEDVNERIRSGLLGNTEAIEDLGINVNVALIETTNAFKRYAGDKSWEKLDFNMQQQIRLAAILEQSYQKYGDSLNDNVISRTNKATAVFANFQKQVGDAFILYVEEILPKITEAMQAFSENESNMNAVIGTIQILIESLSIAWDMVGFLVDEMKAGAAVILQMFINPILNGIASLSEALASIKIPGLDMSSYENIAKSLRATAQGINDIVASSTESAKENYAQMVESFNNIWEIANGNIKKSAIETKEEVKKVVEDLPKAEIIDEKELERIQEILLQFEIDYRETMGKNEEAARLSVEAQKKIYEEAGVDRVRLEEWANMHILRSKTDLLSGIKRGFHDLALESSDYATQAESLLSNAFSSAEDALTEFVTTGQTDFKAFADAIISDIARMAIKMAIIAPLERAFSGMFNGSSVGSAGVKHSGGMVESAGASRSVPMSLFAGAPRFHNGGMLAPDEVPIIAQTGERVLNREETKEYNAGRGVSVPVNVVVNNNNGSNVDVKQSSNNQGGMDIEVIIGDIAAKQIAKKGSLAYKAVTNNNKQDLIKR